MSFVQPRELVVMDAGTKIVNGYYEENGIHNNKPKYRQLDENGNIVLHNGKPIEIVNGGGNSWWMGIWSAADKGWFYLAENKSSSILPKDGWNVVNNGIAPSPTITFLNVQPFSVPNQVPLKKRVITYVPPSYWSSYLSGKPDVPTSDYNAYEKAEWEKLKRDYHEKEERENRERHERRIGKRGRVGAPITEVPAALVATALVAPAPALVAPALVAPAPALVAPALVAPALAAPAAYEQPPAAAPADGGRRRRRRRKTNKKRKTNKNKNKKYRKTNKNKK